MLPPTIAIWSKPGEMTTWLAGSISTQVVPSLLDSVYCWFFTRENDVGRYQKPPSKVLTILRSFAAIRKGWASYQVFGSVQVDDPGTCICIFRLTLKLPVMGASAPVPAGIPLTLLARTRGMGVAPVGSVTVMTSRVGHGALTRHGLHGFDPWHVWTAASLNAEPLQYSI